MTDSDKDSSLLRCWRFTAFKSFMMQASGLYVTVKQLRNKFNKSVTFKYEDKMNFGREY